MFNLTHWNPVEDLTRLHREMDRMFMRAWGDTPETDLTSSLPSRTSTFVPPTDITSDGDAWHVRVALPGVDPSDVQVEVTNNVLSVSGDRPYTPTPERQTQLSEIGYGHFERRFTLPARIDVTKVKATFLHGVLELTLPLEEASKPRRIAISGTSERLAA